MALNRTSWVELCVSDFAQSITWFEQALGFRVVAREADDYAELSRGETTIQLAAENAQYWASEHPHLLPAGQRGSGVEIVLLVEDVEAIYQQAQLAGANIVRELADYPWQMRQFWVRHPDGYLIRPAQKLLSVNTTTYQRQVANAFRRTAPLVTDELTKVKEVADTLVRQQEFLEGATIYETLISEIFKNSHLYYDEDEDEYDDEYDYNEYDEEEDHDEEEGLEEFVGECVETLGGYLADTRTANAARQKIISVLFDIYLRDLRAINELNFATRIADQLVRYTTTWERGKIIESLDELLTDENEELLHQEHARLLLKLGQETLDDEEYLRVCRENELTLELVDRLLMLGRIDEAEKITQRADGEELLDLANLFIQYKQDVVAERLVRACIQVQHIAHALEWLRHYYQARGNQVAELEILAMLFRDQPSLTNYQELRSLATQLDRWESTQPKLLAFLEQAHNTPLLIQIALDEGKIDTALQLLKTMATKDRYGYTYTYNPLYGNEIDLAVARAAEETRPYEAIQLYRNHAERLIAQRNRKSYQEACPSLARIHSLYERLGNQNIWTQYIATLREENRTLRALKEELTKAGL